MGEYYIAILPCCIINTSIIIILKFCDCHACIVIRSRLEYFHCNMYMVGLVTGPYLSADHFDQVSTHVTITVAEMG